MWRELPRELLPVVDQLLVVVRLTVRHARQLCSGVQHLVLRLRRLSQWILPIQWVVQLQLRPVRIHEWCALQLRQDRRLELLRVRWLSRWLPLEQQLVQLELCSVRVHQRDPGELRPGLWLELLHV